MNFERANSAHAAAKEMVYLAEEGLKAEGRTFDHAWQVLEKFFMLNMFKVIFTIIIVHLEHCIHFQIYFQP